ncbi:hypothetical protein B4U80_14134 [Leptotrombidium deliense]|uniref:Uncharacterized protein n=1 Tax=Leptotrombidium deliense TaxID=299467 RepID=A0A443S215_9ACAR|nr:hypothetical protein B4U80_14134 [Leptotrombidium deliense]
MVNNGKLVITRPLLYIKYIENYKAMGFNVTLVLAESAGVSSVNDTYSGIYGKLQSGEADCGFLHVPLGLGNDVVSFTTTITESSFVILSFTKKVKMKQWDILYSINIFSVNTELCIFINPPTIESLHDILKHNYTLCFCKFFNLHPYFRNNVTAIQGLIWNRAKQFGLEKTVISFAKIGKAFDAGRSMLRSHSVLLIPQFVYSILVAYGCISKTRNEKKSFISTFPKIDNEFAISVDLGHKITEVAQLFVDSFI